MTPQTTAPTDRPPMSRADHPSVPPARPFDPALHPTPHRDPTADECERWAGQHIAWSWDGTTILGGAASPAELYEQLRRAGVDTNRIVFDYVDEPGATYL